MAAARMAAFSARGKSESARAGVRLGELDTGVVAGDDLRSAAIVASASFGFPARVCAFRQQEAVVDVVRVERVERLVDLDRAVPTRRSSRGYRPSIRSRVSRESLPARSNASFASATAFAS
jgi:hypothetical protein